VGVLFFLTLLSVAVVVLLLFIFPASPSFLLFLLCLSQALQSTSEAAQHSYTSMQSQPSQDEGKNKSPTSSSRLHHLWRTMGAEEAGGCVIVVYLCTHKAGVADGDEGSGGGGGGVEWVFLLLGNYT